MREPCGGMLLPAGRKGAPPMPRDAQDHEVTAASGEAVRAFDHAVEGYLTQRADAAQRIAPGFGMAHLLKGYLAIN